MSGYDLADGQGERGYCQLKPDLAERTCGGHSLIPDKSMEGTSKNREPVIVTKRGKPLAEIIPFAEKTPLPSKVAETLVFEGDIVSPLGEEIWTGCR